jgi:hypothetical protein
LFAVPRYEDEPLDPRQAIVVFAGVLTVLVILALGAAWFAARVRGAAG